MTSIHESFSILKVSSKGPLTLNYESPIAVCFAMPWPVVVKTNDVFRQRENGGFELKSNLTTNHTRNSMLKCGNGAQMTYR